MHGQDLKVKCNLCNCEFEIHKDLDGMISDMFIPRIYECKPCRHKRSFERTRLKIIRLYKKRNYIQLDNII